MKTYRHNTYSRDHEIPLTNLAEFARHHAHTIEIHPQLDDTIIEFISPASGFPSTILKITPTGYHVYTYSYSKKNLGMTKDLREFISSYGKAQQ